MNKVELNYEQYFNNLIFAERNPTKKHANDFLNLFVDLIIETHNSPLTVSNGKENK